MYPAPFYSISKLSILYIILHTIMQGQGVGSRSSGIRDLSRTSNKNMGRWTVTSHLQIRLSNTLIVKEWDKMF